MWSLNQSPTFLNVWGLSLHVHLFSTSHWKILHMPQSCSINIWIKHVGFADFFVDAAYKPHKVVPRFWTLSRASWNLGHQKQTCWGRESMIDSVAAGIPSMCRYKCRSTWPASDLVFFHGEDNKEGAWGRGCKQDWLFGPPTFYGATELRNRKLFYVVIYGNTSECVHEREMAARTTVLKATISTIFEDFLKCFRNLLEHRISFSPESKPL